MSDLAEKTAEAERPRDDATSEEIARSLGSLWQRFSGQRPKSTSVEMKRNGVRCVIEEGASDAEVEDPDETADDPKLSPAGLKHNATSAVARITGKRVVAFIVKTDKEAKTSTQTFHYDRPPERF
jgi:uncharacterized protein YbcI